jgi:hypothetical protein
MRRAAAPGRAALVGPRRPHVPELAEPDDPPAIVAAPGDLAPDHWLNSWKDGYDVAVDPRIYPSLPDQVRQDALNVYAAVSGNGFALSVVPVWFRSDPVAVLLAVNSKPSSILYASAALKKDCTVQELVKTVLSTGRRFSISELAGFVALTHRCLETRSPLSPLWGGQRLVDLLTAWVTRKVAYLERSLATEQATIERLRDTPHADAVQLRAAVFWESSLVLDIEAIGTDKLAYVETCADSLSSSTTMAQQVHMLQTEHAMVAAAVATLNLRQQALFTTYPMRYAADEQFRQIIESNPHYLYAAANEDGMVLQFLGERSRIDRTAVFLALNSNPAAEEFVPAALLADPAVQELLSLRRSVGYSRLSLLTLGHIETKQMYEFHATLDRYVAGEYSAPPLPPVDVPFEFDTVAKVLTRWLVEAYRMFDEMSMVEKIAKYSADMYEIERAKPLPRNARRAREQLELVEHLERQMKISAAAVEESIREYNQDLWDSRAVRGLIVTDSDDSGLTIQARPLQVTEGDPSPSTDFPDPDPEPEQQP